LHQVQPGRRSGEGQFLRDGDENLQMPQLHTRIISYSDAGKRRSSLA
jgi:hypothetical protein